MTRQDNIEKQGSLTTNTCGPDTPELSSSNSSIDFSARSRKLKRSKDMSFLAYLTAKQSVSTAAIFRLTDTVERLQMAKHKEPAVIYQ